MADTTMTPLQALRFMDRNITILKSGLDYAEKDQFDDALNALWELAVNGTKIS